MTSPDIDKIAEEASHTICDAFGMTYPSVGFLGAQHWNDVTAIIKSAIDKAYRQGLNEGFGKGKQAGMREALEKK